MIVKNFWSSEEIKEWYKNHPGQPKIYENAKGWFVLMSDNTFHWHEKDDNFQPERSKREDCQTNVLKMDCRECSKEIWYLAKPKRETVSCKCGALNIAVTQ